jgi:hypothetical protein
MIEIFTKIDTVVPENELYEATTVHELVLQPNGWFGIAGKAKSNIFFFKPLEIRICNYF